MERLPWLDYTGQTSPELIACKNSHRIDSLLCAFEEGIQAKLDPQDNGGMTGEEELVLAVMALNREVNNGGYHQFFVNSSQKFAPVILDCLRRIDCVATAAITERALVALQLPELSVEAISAAIFTENLERDEVLNACDNEFYQLNEITPKLFSFVEAHQGQIRLVKASLPPRRPPAPTLDNASILYIHLAFSKKTGLSLDDARHLTQELARQNSIPATDAELEGASVLHAFRCSLRARDFAACELLAPRAFELMRENTVHCMLHRDWMGRLIGASKQELADASTLAYLEYLAGCDQSTLSTQNRILFWAALLQKYRAALPKSVEFFVANFPDENLDEPLPIQRFVAKERPAARPSSRKTKKG